MGEHRGALLKSVINSTGYITFAIENPLKVPLQNHLRISVKLPNILDFHICLNCVDLSIIDQGRVFEVFTSSGENDPQWPREHLFHFLRWTLAVYETMFLQINSALSRPVTAIRSNRQACYRPVVLPNNNKTSDLGVNPLLESNLAYKGLVETVDIVPNALRPQRGKYSPNLEELLVVMISYFVTRVKPLT
jgi:hypothetical protein